MAFSSSQISYQIPDCNIKNGYDSLIGVCNTESLLECSAKCINNCKCFGFNPLSKVSNCRLHRSCEKANSTSDGNNWIYFNPSGKGLLAKSCLDLFNAGRNCSRLYTIYPWMDYDRPVEVFCDMSTDGGGWTIIQRRLDGSLSFNRPWTEYKQGFGKADSEHWLGNDYIHQLTISTPSLYVGITLNNGTSFYAHYPQFSISDETDGYRLHLNGTALGTLDDSMRAAAAMNITGWRFSTPDRDYDAWPEGSCSSHFKGGWWFNWCSHTFLNGEWGLASWERPWIAQVSDGTSVASTVMMIR
ncbi:ryncolin-1-like [Saccostrea cucullata]|uniref:ryncolin-1-like n=1 Tax=Saccostrea cuccullata TaxID=36930 RepID=UPI002ED3218A